MEKIIYNKPAIDVDKQIELLKSRNLIISNIDDWVTIGMLFDFISIL